MAKSASIFDTNNFNNLCNSLSQKDRELGLIIKEHGYPPMWTRSNTFASLIHIILEQQVSLASAKAALNKLKQKIGRITPGNLLSLSDSEMKACYFSRQKIVYARHLAETILSGKINLKKLALLPDDEVRKILKEVKGIGDWTADIYLIFVLRRTDILPIGDLAMRNAMKEIKKLNKDASADHLLKIAGNWQPYRTIATMILWHHYIKTRNIRL
ncbi:MAG: DNA-3-methyladenine glycosylase 2 family protein [Bacteroidota bacterium]